MATTIVSNSTAATFGNSPQKTGEPLDHATLYSGKALEFDGVADYITADEALGTIDISADYWTIAMWLNFTTVPASGADIGIFTCRDGERMGIILSRNDGSYSSHIQIVTFGAEGYVRRGDLYSKCNDGNWHYIVGCTSQGTLTFYIDGVITPIATGSMPDIGSLGLADDVLDIGGYGGTTAGTMYDGKMSNFQIWNKVWSADDVKYAYENPEKLITDNASVTDGITTSNLKLWYPMNDTGIRSPQTVVFDAAGTNNTTKNHATTTFLGDELWDSGNASNFDSGTGSWVKYSTNNMTNDSSALKIDRPSSGGDARGANLVLNNSKDLQSDLTVGRTYKLVFDAKKSGNNITVRVFYSSISETVSVTTTDFTSYSITFEAEHATSMYLEMQSMAANDAIWLDNMSLKEVGTATGWTDADQVDTIPQTALMNGNIMQVSATADENTDYISGSMPTFTDADIHSIFIWWFPHDFPNGTSVSDSRYGLFRTATPAWSLKVQDNDIKFTKEGVADYSATDNNYTEQKWFLTGYTRNGTGSNTGKLYTNGVAGTTFTPAASGFDGSTTYKFGSSNVTTTQPPLFGEVMMFDAELTALEVTELYNSGAPLNATKHSQASNLVGYWRNNHLTSAGTWEDLSSNNNHGTLNGTHSTIFFQEGVTANLDSQGFITNITHPSGGAAWFDGVNSYINAGSNNTIDDIWRSSATVEFWIKPMSATAADRVMDKKPSGTDGWYISLEDVSGAACDIQLKCDATTTDSTQITASREIALYQWNYVSIVYDGSVVTNTATIYVGGGSTNAKPTSKTVTSTNPGAVPLATDAANDLAIGGRSGTETANSFDGFIDEVRIYKRVLTLAEVTKNFNHGKSKHSN